MKRPCAFARLSISALFVLSAAVTAARQVQKRSAAASVTFTDVTKQAGIAWQHVNGATPEKHLIETMGGGGGFLDYNGDGRLDIFLVQSGCHKFSANCKAGKNALYRQNPDGTFTDVAKAAGVANSGVYGMGVAVADFDNDGRPDIYVTGFPHNVLYHSNRDGTFTDVTEKAGVAGAGWGTSAAFFDYNHDGLPDHEPNNLFHNNGDGTFTDMTVERGMGTVALATSGFGTRFLDFDNDGKLDLVVLNGHVLDNIALYHEGVAFAERPFLLHNTGTRFEEVGALHAVAFQKSYVGRALATGDFDNDGDMDLLWVINGGPPVLLRNDGGNRNAWIGFDLRGTLSGRDAFGTVITVTAAGQRQVREKVGGASYLAAQDPRILIGLADAKKVDKVEVRWPSGATSVLENVPVGQYVLVEEPMKPAASAVRRAPVED